MNLNSSYYFSNDSVAINYNTTINLPCVFIKLLLLFIKLHLKGTPKLRQI